MEKSSNILLKTIVFVIVVAITCLLFFGLSEGDKTDVQLVSFGFLVFAEFVIYASFLLPNIIGGKKLNSADIISAGVLYGIASFILNYVIVIGEMRPLIIYNIIAILLYLLIFAAVMLMKKK